MSDMSAVLDTLEAKLSVKNCKSEMRKRTSVCFFRSASLHCWTIHVVQAFWKATHLKQNTQFSFETWSCMIDWLVWPLSARLLFIFSACSPHNVIKLISHWKHSACEIYAGLCESAEELLRAALNYSTTCNDLGTVRHPPSPTCSWEHELDPLLHLDLLPLI